jgi:PBP1b-binding outer membrane lipoprotein LpoB
MKRNKLMITLLAAAAFAVGCNKEATTSEQLDKAQAKTAEATRDMKDYSYAQKAQFVEKMQGELAALNADVWLNSLPKSKNPATPPKPNPNSRRFATKRLS